MKGLVFSERFQQTYVSPYLTRIGRIIDIKFQDFVV